MWQLTAERLIRSEITNEKEPGLKRFEQMVRIHLLSDRSDRKMDSNHLLIRKISFFSLFKHKIIHSAHRLPCQPNKYYYYIILQFKIHLQVFAISVPEHI